MSILKLSNCPNLLNQSFQPHDKVIRRCKELMFFSGPDRILMGNRESAPPWQPREIYSFFIEVVLRLEPNPVTRKRCFRICELCS